MRTKRQATSLQPHNRMPSGGKETNKIVDLKQKNYSVYYELNGM